VDSVPDCPASELDLRGFVDLAELFDGVEVAYRAFSAVVTLWASVYNVSGSTIHMMLL
jgi:hypothetical protein